MKRIAWLGCALVAAAAVAQTSAVEDFLPNPWIHVGIFNLKYECKVGVDPQLESSGVPNLTLKCDQPGRGFVGVMQPSFSALDYRGTRVRFSARVKAQEVGSKGGALFMHADQGFEKVLVFDNMSDRRIVGTQDWQRYSVVFDVPQVAQKLTFGMELGDQGQLWMSDIMFEIVGLDVPVTVPDHPENRPENLELSR